MRAFWDGITSQVQTGLTILVLFLLMNQALAADSPVTRPGSAPGNFPNLEAITQQAEHGDARAQFKLGDYYYAQGKFQEAVRWYGRSARQGNAVAQTALANCYATGRGVKRNPTEAAKWSKLATHQRALPPRIAEGKVVSQKSAPPVANTVEVTMTSSSTPAPIGSPVSSMLRSEGPSYYPTVVRRVFTLQAPEPRIQGSQLVFMPVH